MERQWEEVVSILDFAFQPIVNIHTGLCIGFEALLRRVQEAGFSSIHRVFDWAFSQGFLHVFDLALREKAIEKFTTIPRYQSLKLFFNLDPRVVMTPEYQPGNTLRILKRYGLSPEQVVLEVSENYRIQSVEVLRRVLEQYRSQGFQVAIDDYGIGFSGPQLLYLFEPEYVKIPRFFIENVGQDSRKKLFLINLVATSHILGTMVIAEGVEREGEFYGCLDIGCDAVQGFLVEAPKTDCSELKERYEIVETLHTRNRRKVQSTTPLILDHIEAIPAVHSEEPLTKVCELLRAHPGCRFLPVTTPTGEPLGIIHEEDLHRVIYTPYGHALLENPAIFRVDQFLRRCAVFEVTTPLETLLSAFALEENRHGILVTRDGRYIGFLSPQSLLRILYEKHLYEVRDQNPLTGLPGNTRIAEYLDESLSDGSSKRVYAYFDIDHFKSFNDHYGFRRGDRVILLLASLLREAFPENQYFIGHIGGDDFFVGAKQHKAPFNLFLEKTQEVLERFSRDVVSFYDQEDRKRGYILGEDREGNPKKFSLLQATGVLLCLPEGCATCTPDMLSEKAAQLKKRAKQKGIRCIIHVFSTEEPSCLNQGRAFAFV
ncbi:MAG: GGDEF domain-containing protein [Candidatus Caldatribacterium sp.]|nr:GGDEF domain-containing protein [Candidatus Caldatribacterium sp.]